MKAYQKFGGMVLTSIIVMFLFTYWNTYKIDHILFSETRAYMALLLSASMAVIMLLFMQNMLTNRKMNIGIIVCSIAIFLLSLYLVRSQTLVTMLTIWKR